MFIQPLSAIHRWWSWWWILILRLSKAHQRTHQLVRPGLRSSIMRLMEVRVVLLASLVKKLSKSRKIVKESKSFKGLKNLQRPLVRRNVYQSTNPPSIRYEELKLPLKLWQFFELFLLGPKSSLEATSASIIDKAKLMELLMLYYVFLQWEEDFQAKNTRILQPKAPLHRVFGLQNSRPPSA